MIHNLLNSCQNFKQKSHVTAPRIIITEKTNPIWIYPCKNLHRHTSVKMFTHTKCIQMFHNENVAHYTYDSFEVSRTEKLYLRWKIWSWKNSMKNYYRKLLKLYIFALSLLKKEMFAAAKWKNFYYASQFFFSQ